ncbi:MAG: tetratricopeptide repeat protein [Lentisphaerota bacterium]
MGKLLDLTFYNPAQLADEDFIKGFVARRELAEKLLARLKDIKPRNVAQHRLIIGQRGMGKTSLLRRIALGVRESPDLSSVLLPLTFREEQYNVHNLHVFWCNCLDALGDWFEATGQHAQAARVDQDVAALNKREDDDEGSNALGLFREWMKREGKRALLLLDNMDLIFDGLKSKQWSLRRVLQESGGIVIIGATASFLEATVKPDAPFYDFFQVDVLEKLDHTELLSCLRQLAAERGEAGKKVIEVLDSDPGRIHVLYSLTGGNPRTLAMLYLMLEMSDDGDIMRDLERLLDLATPLYKARIEEFAPQARVVFDAIALNWNPVTAADLAVATGLEVSAVSTQLDRLNKNGVLEKTSLASSVRTGFQLGERFFNIWYLMRHAPRRQRNRLRWLTEFLRNFYAPSKLIEMAVGLMNRPGRDHLTRSAYCLALSEAMQDAEMRDALRFESAQEMERHAAEMGVSIESLGGVTELHTPKDAREWFRLGYTLKAKIGAYERAEAAFRKAIELSPKSAKYWTFLGSLLADPLARYEEAEAAFRKALEIDPKEVYAWVCLGTLLADPLARYEDAETAFRKALEIDPKDAYAWSRLGDLLAEKLARYEEAEAAYRTAIEADPKYVFVWIFLGDLLAKKLARYEEAETAYRTAIEADPKNIYSWNRLGRLLVDSLGREKDSETAFRQVLQIDAGNILAITKLSYLLLKQQNHKEEAEIYCQKAIEALPVPAVALLKAYRCFVNDDFGMGVKELMIFFATENKDIIVSFFDDLLRVLRLVASRGYGEKLLNWFNESGQGDRYWPLYAAFDAYLNGEEKLKDINPEVRSAASRIFSALTRVPQQLPLDKTDE